MLFSFGALTLALMTGCGADDVPIAVTPAPPAAVPIVSQAEIDAAEGRVLAPSPMELDAAVRKAGLAETMGSLVPERTYNMAATDQGAVAVRTGVMLADTVFTGEGESAELLVARAQSVRDGLKRVGAADELIGRIDDMISRMRSGAASRQELLSEVDSVTSAIVPDAGWGPEDRSGPLVQAGVWLESAHLVSGACVAKGDTIAATGLLRDRDIVAYFLKYVQLKGGQHAPSPVVDKLVATLGEVQSISAKDRLDAADVQRIHELTGSVLALL